MSRWGRGFFRLVGWTAAAALVVVIALAALFMIDIHRDQTPPDVAGIAHSQPVAAADLAAASATSADLKVLTPPAASWLVPGPTSISDFCESTHDAEFTPTPWEPTTCTRTVAAYFFFNGPLQQHMQTWDAAFRAAGWSNYEDPPDRSPADSASFTLPIPPDDANYADQVAYLTFTSVERPRATPSLQHIDGAPLPVTDSNTVIAWIQQPKATASPDAVESAAFARYQFVVVATLTTRYYDPSALPPTPSTSPTFHGCYSGSNDCN